MNRIGIGDVSIFVLEKSGSGLVGKLLAGKSGVERNVIKAELEKN